MSPIRPHRPFWSVPPPMVVVVMMMMRAAIVVVPMAISTILPRISFADDPSSSSQSAVVMAWTVIVPTYHHHHHHHHQHLDGRRLPDQRSSHHCSFMPSTRRTISLVLEASSKADPSQDHSFPPSSSPQRNKPRGNINPPSTTGNRIPTSPPPSQPVLDAASNGGGAQSSGGSNRGGPTGKGDSNYQINNNNRRNRIPPSHRSSMGSSHNDDDIASIRTAIQLKDTIHEIAATIDEQSRRLANRGRDEGGDVNNDDDKNDRVMVVTQRQCDILMGLCVALDERGYILEVLEIMRIHGYQQERSTYRECLQACLDFGNADSALDILNDMDRARMEPRPADIGFVISTYCCCRSGNDKSNDNNDNDTKSRPSWRKGWRLLKACATVPTNMEEKEKDEALYYSMVVPIQAYNDVLSCLKVERQWKEAIRLLRYMETGAPAVPTTGTDQSKTVQAKEQTETVQTSTTQPTNVSALPAQSFGNYGFIIPAPGVITYHTVIECCTASQEADQAVQLLYTMRDRGLKPRSSTFQIVLSLLSRKLQWRRALNLLDMMEEMDVSRTVVHYNTVISACARAREVGTAKNLLSRMKQRDNIAPDEISYNSVIGACASTARWKDALAVLDQCYREPGVTPNIYIYTNAMKACARGGKTQRALNLLQVVKDKGLPLDSYCYTAVIDACAKAKMWRKALALFDEMDDKGIEPSEVTYSVTISALGSGLQWERALSLLNLMREKGMNPNLITYNAAITALAKAARQNARDSDKLASGHVASRNGSHETEHATSEDSNSTTEVDLSRKALDLLQQMIDDGIEPDGFCYSSAISCCGAQGRWKEACGLIETMKKGGPRTRPNKVAYTAAVSACGRAGESGKALELFQNMKDEGLSPDCVAYNALFSALRKANDGKKSYELWGEICGTIPSTTRAIATAKHVASPDIITVTDCIATLSRNGMNKEMDEVFGQAVDRWIVLRGNALDGQWEVDLSGMPFPVARAACRYLLTQIQVGKSPDSLQDMVFITGVGIAQQRRKDNSSSKNDSTGSVLEKDPTTSLRDYVQGILKSDFVPALESTIPDRAKGTVVVGQETLARWLEVQNLST